MISMDGLQMMELQKHVVHKEVRPLEASESNERMHRFHVLEN